jgi:hypothetical protein
MGALLPTYKTTLVNSIVDGIAANTTCLYAFAANPVPFSGNTPAIELSDYDSAFLKGWHLIFGKRLGISDVVPMIRNIAWTSNTVYDQYDNTDDDLHVKDFYVLSPPSLTGGPYNVYKCINNANGAPSTDLPSLLQASSFTTGDGYTWRYITTITAAEYDKFHTDDYAPCYTNTTIAASAFSYAGIENCIITNGGNGYSSYSISDNNYVISVVNSTLIQIQNYESVLSNYYVGNGIYLYNVSASTSQLLRVAGYSSNGLGNFISLSSPANTENIQTQITKYLISPAVTFTSDANSAPAAYTTINTTSNSILSIVIVDTGAGITWCNVAITTNTAAVVSNATAYAIVAPPGGHGYDPASELFTQAMGMSFTFSNTEVGTISTDTIYNQIGILVNPNTVYSNTTPGPAYTANTFSSLLTANLSPTTPFAVGNTLIGSTSGARGTVAFCNGTHISLTGDKHFVTGETVVSSNGASSVMTLNTIGQVYTKNIKPLYIQHITNVTRSANNAESYKLIIGL